MLIKRFEDIDVWKEARKLVNMAYNLTGGDLFRDCCKMPILSLPGLTGQSRSRQISSVKCFWIPRTSRGMTVEVHFATAPKYISEQEFNESYNQAKLVGKLANGFIRYLRTGKPANRQTG